MIASVKNALTGAFALCAAIAFTAEASARSCEAYARDVANASVPTGGNVVGGAVVGAIGGAIIGGIIGGSRGAGTGAAVGAGTGAVGGLGRSSVEWDRAYRRAFRRCRNGRTYTGAAPRPWTRGWYNYCSSRYRTFNASTGYYYYKPGKKRFCR